MDCSMPGFPVHHQQPELAQTLVHRVSGALQQSHPLSSPSSAFNLSQYQVFLNESVLHMRCSKYWISALASVQFSSVAQSNLTLATPWTAASNKYSGLISLRIYQLDLLAVILKENPESLFQHLRSKALILQHSAFFMVQLSHPYMTTAKTIALTRWNFVGKVMSLLFNMLSRLVIAFFQGASVFNCIVAVTICNEPKKKSPPLFPLYHNRQEFLKINPGGKKRGPTNENFIH